MTTKKSYSRYFIILQEEEKGYSLASDKLSSGYAKFEIKNEKCKISYYVQNLKKETSPYHMILICNKKETKKLINLGELNIDDNGRAEVSYEYNVENIAGSSIGVEKVVGAAIVKFADKDIIPVMVGFITTDTQDDWKRFTLFFNEKSKDVEEQKVQDVVSTVEKEVSDIHVTEEIPVNTTQVDIEEKPVMASSNGEEEPKSQDDGVSEKEGSREEPVEDTNNVFENYEKNIENIKNMENLEQEKNVDVREFPIGAIGNYFKNIAEGLNEVKGVCKEIKRCKWYKVPIKSKKDLYDVFDYNKYTVIYYPMYNYFNYIKKYEHFMIGYKCDNSGRMKYMIFAIPGIKSIVEQPFQGKSGFVTWVPLKEGEEAEDNFGYWLMFYDFRNRTIAIPIKK